MPFVLGPDLEPGFQLAAELGFDAIEIFPPTLDSIDVPKLKELAAKHSLPVSTIGTGGGAVAQGLTLTDPDADVRSRAKDYIRGVIDRAGELGGSAILGSMQGRAGDRDKAEVIAMLGDAMAEMAEYATKWNQPFLYEPLNRYETDLIHRLDDAKALLEKHEATNAQILADLFHANIEEADVCESLKRNASRIGHVHFVDSNRWPAGNGHSDMTAAWKTLASLNFQGYLAVESFPLPNPTEAAKAAANWFNLVKAGAAS